MSYRIFYPDSYLKRASKFLKKHPDLRNQYQKTLELIEMKPCHPSLRLHGRLAGFSSVSINLSYRLVLEFVIQDSDIILVDVGSHDQVY